MGAIIDTLNKRKVELKSEQVDLGLVQDLESMSTDYFKQSGRMEMAIQKIEKAQDELSKEWVQAEKRFSEMDSTYQQLRRNAKVLGLDVPKEAENNYKTAITQLKTDLANFKKFAKK